jgi:hypothetical protein
MMETVASLTLLAVISLAIASLLTAGINSQKRSRDRTVAEQVSTREMEKIRQLPYSSIGVLNGNPAGTLTASEAVAGTGLLITRQVRWVDDPAPGAFDTNADYKRVTLTIQRASDSLVLARHTTFVSPADDASYGGSTRGTVKVRVIDMVSLSPTQDVTVSIAGGPSAAASDTTDAAGYALFPSLLPNPASGSQAYYDVTITEPSGYVIKPGDLPGASGSPAHLKVTAGTTTSPVLNLYRPATIYFSVTKGGVPYTGSATVKLDWTEWGTPKTSNYTFTNGTYNVTPVVPGIQYTASASATGLIAVPVQQTVPQAYPTDLTSTFNLALLPTLTVTVKRKPSGQPCTTVSNATVKLVKSGLPTVTVVTGADGIAKFEAASGSGYSIQVTSSYGNKTLSNQTVLAPPNFTNKTVSVVGTCT